MSKADQIRARLERLYSPEDAAKCWRTLEPLLSTEDRGRPAELWNQEDSFLITYGDSVKEEGVPPLQSLTRFVRSHLDDAIRLVHILPFFPYTSDDGFSISDYDAVRPDLGGWEHIEELAGSHDLMFDLVLNHCSASHEWFEQFLRCEKPGASYFHAVDPSLDLSQTVRPRTHPLLTPYETAEGTKHVWTTFSADQVDLNFSNPDVLLSFLEIMMRYVKQGARMIRLDAIAFLWKEPGTTSLHLPQTHEVVKLMRDVLDVLAPQVVLLTETNVPHQENVSYFGQGDEARMVYQFSLPPLLMISLRNGDASPLTAWAKDLEPPPEGCTFFNFTASHDGIGVRPLEGLVPQEQVNALAEELKAEGGRVNERSHPDGSTTPYELNVTYFSAMRKAGESKEIQRKRFLLSQTIPMCLQGIPAFYIHSFTATENDLEGLSRTGQNRSINRRQWDKAELDDLLATPESDQAVILREMKRRLEVRRTLPEFHPDVPQVILEVDPRIFAVKRGSVLALHNFSQEDVPVQVEVLETVFADSGVQIQEASVTLPALSMGWFRV
jgi:sucrose phosphorylase